MSDESQSGARLDSSDAAGEEEILDAIPVLAEEPGMLAAGGSAELERRRSGPVVPAVQAAALAAGGFVAGAAVVGLVHRHQRRALLPAKAGRGIGRGGRRSNRAGELVQIVGSRSLLVDVHLLGGTDTAR